MQCLCATSLEKGVKGLYRKKLSQEPPRVHNLIYLLNEIGIKPPEPIGRFIVKLNEASVATRYPEEIRKLEKDFTQRVVKNILSEGRKTLEWIKRQL